MDPQSDRSRAPLVRFMEQARSQHNVASSGQAAKLGIGYQALWRAVEAGKLERDLPRIYRLAGSERTWESSLMAALLWLDRPDGCVSHFSAAALWELPGSQRGPIEISTSRWKKPLPPVVVHKSVVPVNAYTTTVGSIAVTNAGRTLVDIAGFLAEDTLEVALEDALRRRLTTIGHLRWTMRGLHGKGAKGVGTLRRLIDRDAPLTESTFEIKLLQELRKAKLPLPERQVEVKDGERLVARVDFAYPWAKVAVEADSYMFHSGRGAWESDLIRRSDLAALGWLVIHVTYREMKSGMDRVIERIKNALAPRLDHP